MDAVEFRDWMTTEQAVAELHECWEVLSEAHAERHGMPIRGLPQVRLLLARLAEEARALPAAQGILQDGTLRYLGRKDVVEWLDEEMGTDRTDLRRAHVRTLLERVGVAFSDALAAWEKWSRAE